jgi:hypothetical protein
MNRTSVWKHGKAGKKKSINKSKIRWEALGLLDPKLVDTASSIETIRREVSSLASHGMRPDTHFRPVAPDSKSQGRNSRSGANRTGRRGATEEIPDGA